MGSGKQIDYESDVRGSIQSLQLSPGCKKVLVYDYDGNGYNDDNIWYDESVSSLPSDLNCDATGIKMVAKSREEMELLSDTTDRKKKDPKRSPRKDGHCLMCDPRPAHKHLGKFGSVPMLSEPLYWKKANSPQRTKCLKMHGKPHRTKCHMRNLRKRAIKRKLKHAKFIAGQECRHCGYFGPKRNRKGRQRKCYRRFHKKSIQKNGRTSTRRITKLCPKACQRLPKIGKGKAIGGKAIKGMKSKVNRM